MNCHRFPGAILADKTPAPSISLPESHGCCLPASIRFT